MKGWRCPICGSDSLNIQVSVWVDLIQTLDRTDGIDENEWTTTNDKNESWDENSMCTCNECGYQEKMKMFEFESGPLGTIPVFAEQKETKV